jgi:hypothetical protein
MDQVMGHQAADHQAMDRTHVRNRLGRRPVILLARLTDSYTPS